MYRRCVDTTAPKGIPTLLAIFTPISDKWLVRAPTDQQTCETERDVIIPLS